MSAVTSDRVKAGVIDPVLDGIAANDYQAIALHNPATPEADSLLEQIDSLHLYSVPPDVIDAMRNTLWLIAEWNGRERQCQRTVAGNGEQIARDLKATSPSLKPANVRELLRPMLDVLVKGSKADPMEYARAHGDLKRAIRRIPDETLLSRSLEGEIGKAKAALLRDLLGGA